MRLRTRLSLALSGLALAVLAVSAALTLWAEGRYLERKDKEDKALLMDRFARGCGEALKLKSEAALAGYLLSTTEEPGRVFAGFFPPDGKALIHSDPSLKGRTLILPSSVRKLMALGEAEVPKPDLDTGRPLTVHVRKVSVDGVDRGVAAVGFDPAHLAERKGRALRNTLRRIALVSLAALALSVGLACWLAFLVTRSIEDLADGARALGAGSLSRRIPARGKDEVGELAREFNAMAERLEQAEKSREEFLSSMTHELRSPAASIAGYSDMLLSGEGGPLTPKQEEWAESVLRSARRLGGMIDNLLDVAKLEAGLMEFAPAEVTLEDAANDAADCFLPLARERDVSIKVLPGNGLKAWVDPGSLNQVLLNLLANALKFAPEKGEILVELLAEGKSAVVKVSDTGPGIPPEAKARLFSRFYRAPGSRGKGTGLGLYLCRRLLAAQGGRIWAEDRPGGGAVFCFALPVSKP